MHNDSCYLCNEKKSKILYKKNSFYIVKCLNCSFTYVKPLPLDSQLSKFYDNFDYKNNKLEEPLIRRDAIRSLKIICKHVGSMEKRLLDVGCGRGYFLDEARKIGFEVFGIDYSFKMIKYAKNIFNLNVQNIDVFKYKSQVKFDIITLNQVIEHLSKPRDLIKKCYKLLNPGGLVYIATPNIDSLSAKVLKEHFDHLIPPEHLGYFNNKTLTYLLKSANFNILHTGSWSSSQDLAGIVKRLVIKKINNSNLKSNYALLSSDYSINSRIKEIKYILFDRLFCSLFYRILNIDHLGIMLEVVSTKN